MTDDAAGSYSIELVALKRHLVGMPLERRVATLDRYGSQTGQTDRHACSASRRYTLTVGTVRASSTEVTKIHSAKRAGAVHQHPLFEALLVEDVPTGLGPQDMLTVCPATFCIALSAAVEAEVLQAHRALRHFLEDGIVGAHRLSVALQRALGRSAD
jgi:hypothetical protein